MEFLKGILGDDLYNQFAEKVNAHNGNEANAANQIKIGNLGSGEYVGRGKYDSEIEKLNTLLSGKTAELDSANGLIAELKKSTKGNEDLQGKITSYETQIADLQQQLQETKIKAAMKYALLSEKALDVDYLSYKISEKLREEGKSLELDENDNIKDWQDLASGLRTQYPTQFEAGAGARRVLGDNRLPEGDNTPVTVTKEQFAKMGYSERCKLKQDNEALYKELTKR